MTNAAAPIASAVTASRTAPAERRRARATPHAPAATTARKRSTPTTPASLRNWSGTLCGSVVVTSELVRSMRSVSSNVPAPVPPPGWRVNACHASCHQRHRLLELRLARWPVFDAIWLDTGFANACQMRLAKTAAVTTAASAASPPASAAARSMRRRAGSDEGSRGRTSSIAPATAAAPATTVSAKIQPSCARTACGCPSFVIPGSASATPKTAPAAGAASATAARLSTPSSARRIHATAATHARATPKREYVSSTVTPAPYRRTVPSTARRDTSHSATGTATAATSASSFQ